MGREYCSDCGAWLPKVCDLPDEFYTLGFDGREGPYCSECRDVRIDNGEEPAEGTDEEEESGEAEDG